MNTLGRTDKVIALSPSLIAGQYFEEIFFSVRKHITLLSHVKLVMSSRSLGKAFRVLIFPAFKKEKEYPFPFDLLSVRDLLVELTPSLQGLNTTTLGVVVFTLVLFHSKHLNSDLCLVCYSFGFFLSSSFFCLNICSNWFIRHSF